MGTGSQAGTQAGERLDWLDVARGIGIVAVVAGHVWTRGAVRDTMYSFHMPLFFLFSGYLARPQPVGAFAWKQVGSQMRPYFAFLLLLILADQIIEPLKGGRPIFHTWPGDVWPILFGGSDLRGPYTIFWFVPCLMVARIAFNAVLGRWPARHRVWAPIVAGTLVAAYALGAWTDVSPLGLLTVPMAFVLLWVGAAWRSVVWRGWMVVPLGLLSVLGLILVFPTLNMKAGDYGWPVLSIGAGVATSLLLFRVAERVAPFAGWLGAVGRSSLVVMYLHVALIHYCAPYLGKPVLLAVGLLVPVGAYQAIKAWRPAARVFL